MGYATGAGACTTVGVSPTGALVSICGLAAAWTMDLVNGEPEDTTDTGDNGETGDFSGERTMLLSCRTMIVGRGTGDLTGPAVPTILDPGVPA